MCVCKVERLNRNCGCKVEVMMESDKGQNGGNRITAPAEQMLAQFTDRKTGKRRFSLYRQINASVVLNVKL